MFPFKILVFIYALRFSNSVDVLNSPEARQFLEECDIPNEQVKGIDPCTNHPCKNGAKCYVLGNEAKCDCPEPHFGELCERSPCLDNPCKNNGKCYIEDGETVCSCISIYNGDRCQLKGCFHGSALVPTKAGEKLMKDIQIDDEVASGFNPDGSLKFSKVIAFLHKDQRLASSFIQLMTESTKPLLITKKHLIYRSTTRQDSEAVHADQLRIGDSVSTRMANGITPSVVTDINHVTLTGVYAPLTLDGTIIVNGILASCYAEIDNHNKGHLAFLPLRLHYYLTTGLKSFYSLWSNEEDTVQEHEIFQQETICGVKTKVFQKLDTLGVHWYPKMLCWLSNYDCK